MAPQETDVIGDGKAQEKTEVSFSARFATLMAYVSNRSMGSLKRYMQICPHAI